MKVWVIFFASLLAQMSSGNNGAVGEAHLLERKLWKEWKYGNPIRRFGLSIENVKPHALNEWVKPNKHYTHHNHNLNSVNR